MEKIKEYYMIKNIAYFKDKAKKDANPSTAKNPHVTCFGGCQTIPCVVNRGKGKIVLEKM